MPVIAQADPVQLPNGAMYQGPCDERGLPHGIGILTSGGPLDGVLRVWVYEGELRHGERHGRGTCKYYCTSEAMEFAGEYDGQFEKDQRSGDGRMSYPNGASYDGEWASDKRKGRGKYINSDGSIYFEGQWRDNVAHDERGEQVDPNGAVMCGSPPRDTMDDDECARNRSIPYLETCD